LKGALDIHHGSAEEGVKLLHTALDTLRAGCYELHHPAAAQARVMSSRAEQGWWPELARRSS